MLLARLEPGDIARMNYFDGTAIAPYSAAPAEAVASCA
jgi:hypothetical protein